MNKYDKLLICQSFGAADRKFVYLSWQREKLFTCNGTSAALKIQYGGGSTVVQGNSFLVGNDSVHDQYAKTAGSPCIIFG